MTLTFEQALVEYNYVIQFRNLWNYEIYLFNFDLDPMTLVYTLDLGIVQVYRLNWNYYADGKKVTFRSVKEKFSKCID